VAEAAQAGQTGPVEGRGGVGKPSEWGARAAPWVLVLAPLVLLFEAVLGSKVLVQLDGLLAFEPWKSVAPEGYTPQNPLLLDQSLVVLPWLHFAAERLHAGELPLWNPDNFLGQPIHGALTGAFLWPLSWIYFAVADWGAFAFIAWIKLALAGLGCYRLLLVLGARPLAALAGGLGYTFAGFQIAWLGHPHTNAALLLPWLLLAIEALARAPRGSRRRPLAALAIVGGLLAVSGHVPTAWHVALVGLFWALVRTFACADATSTAKLGARHWGALAGATVLAMGLGAAQILPFWEYTHDSRGRAVAAEVAAEVAKTLPSATELAPVLLFPRWHGDPRAGDYDGPLGPHLNFNELIGGHVGLLLPLLALCALVLVRKRRVVWCLAALGTAAALAAWGVPPLDRIAGWVPGLGATKALRLLLVVAFVLALLGGLGLEALLAQMRSRTARAVLGWAAAAAVAGQLVDFGRGYNPIVAQEHILPATQTGAFAGSHSDGSRILAIQTGHLMPNANLFVGAPALLGYDSIERAAVADVIGLLSTDERGKWFASEIRWFDRSLPLAGLLGVRWLLSSDPLPEPLGLAHTGELLTYENPFFRPLASVARGVVEVPDREQRLAFLGADDFDPTVVPVERIPYGVETYLDAPGAAPRGEVEWIERSPLRRSLRVRLDAPALVVFSSAHDAGWRASVDGTPHPIERVAHALEGLWLPQGDHAVELVYRPVGFAVGAALSTLSVAVLMLLLLPRKPTRRARPQPAIQP